WADAHSAVAASGLARRFPKVPIQPKGLLSTEGVISIPFQGAHPLAIRSHFFEFIDPYHRVVSVSDLRVGERYAVILTTAAGLWRYRLNDIVQVTGRVKQTPSIRFVGRAGLVSDRVGEKLSEDFVADAVARLFAANPPRPGFVLL